MRLPTTSALLSAWEQGRHCHPLDRGLLLYAVAAPEVEPDTLADQPLGQRNAALLRLRKELFGDLLSACLDCPSCGDKLEFTLTASHFLALAGASASSVELSGLRFRLPTTRDLARIARDKDAARAAESLVRLLLEADSGLDEQAASLLSPQLASALEQADPCLEFALNLQCPPCGHSWTSTLDIADFLWEEIDVHSRRLLDEVDVLARTYGWSEREILGLTEARRAAYLQRAIA